MPTKPKTAQGKVSHEEIKSTKPAIPKPPKIVKVAAKKPPRKSIRKKPVFTSKDFERYFFALDMGSFAEYCLEWNQSNLKLKIPKHNNYDQWLNYFKTLSPNAIKMMATTGLDFLPTEAYTALRRWADIINHPSRIDKIHQSGLNDMSKLKPEQDIVALAKNNDRLGVLMAVRDSIAEKLAKGAGSRDTAALAREMGDILDQIADLEKRSGPKSGTVLSNLLNDIDIKKKRPGANGKGARNTSFKSRITIQDMEARA